MTDEQDEIDWGDVVLHMAFGLFFGLFIFCLYWWRVIDIWPFTLLTSFIAPVRELSQHDWNPKRLFAKWSIAFEAWPPFFVIWGLDIAGRIAFGAVQH